MDLPHIAVIYDYACTDEGSAESLSPSQDIYSEVDMINSILAERNYPVFSLGIKNDIIGFLNTMKDKKVDLVFNLCESVCGDSSREMLVPATLDLMSIPYTGSNALTLGLALNKSLTKKILIANNINTPKFKVFYSEIKEIDKKMVDGLKYPLMVKPLLEDGSIGIGQGSVVHNEEQLAVQANDLIMGFKQPALVEEFIPGREIYVPIIGDKSGETILSMSEIDFSELPEEFPPILSYRAKWEKDSIEYQKTMPRCPITLEKNIAEEIKDIALKVFRVMDCRDYARVDIRLREDNVPYIIDVNPNPCLDFEAGLAISAKVSGIEYPDLIYRIVQYAWKRANGNEH